MRTPSNRRTRPRKPGGRRCAPGPGLLQLGSQLQQQSVIAIRSGEHHAHRQARRSLQCRGRDSGRLARLVVEPRIPHVIEQPLGVGLDDPRSKWPTGIGNTGECGRQQHIVLFHGTAPIARPAQALVVPGSPRRSPRPLTVADRIRMVWRECRIPWADPSVVQPSSTARFVDAARAVLTEIMVNTGRCRVSLGVVVGASLCRPRWPRSASSVAIGGIQSLPAPRPGTTHRGPTFSRLKAILQATPARRSGPGPEK